MKLGRLSMAIAVSLVLAAMMSVPAVAAGMSGGPHDFRSTSGITSATGQGDEICKACHVPHNAIGTTGSLKQSLLWKSDYKYTGSLVTDEASLLCMSCHDGTIAAGTGGTDYTMPASANIGDGSGSHPLGTAADMSSLQAGSGLKLPAANNLYVKLPANKQVTCGTCHDPHGTDKMFRNAQGNAGSVICLQCHDK